MKTQRPIPTGAGDVILCEHAVYRYIERVKPAFTYTHAHFELARLLPQAEVCTSPPDWSGWHTEWEKEWATDCYLVLCDSLVFPVEDGKVVTTLTRGTFPPSVRFARTQHHRNKRQFSKAKERDNFGVIRRQRKGKPPRPHFGTEAA